MSYMLIPSSFSILGYPSSRFSPSSVGVLGGVANFGRLHKKLHILGSIYNRIFFGDFGTICEVRVQVCEMEFIM